MTKSLKYKILQFGILIVIIGLFAACSTKRNTYLRRSYHNLTAHYNAFWNGNESLKLGVRQISENNDENYYDILPVFHYGNPQQINAINADLDRTQEKASKVIQEHSMRFKGIEYVKWIDDAYLLIGKAYFYKKEYVAARRTFNFIIQEYPENEIRFDAMLWLAKTYNQKGEYEKSENTLHELQTLSSGNEYSFHVLQQIPLIFAELYLLQNDYSKAAEYIQRGLDKNQKKKLATRLKFILAQLYLQEERFSESAALFEEVIKRNPDDRMSFQAKLNLAMSFNKSNTAEVEKMLFSLMKETENEAFQDQIYFALAELSLNNNEFEKAKAYLQKSVAVSYNNDYQKGKSALYLAELLFEKDEFFKAGLYYDSCLQYIPDNYPEVELLKPRLELMSSLVGNLQTVYEQDSLRNLANMSEDERNAIIDDLIEKYQKAEKERREMEEAQFSNVSAFAQQDYSSSANETGAWYFYNTTTLSYGYSQFINKWGRRKLEDNWRLVRKQEISNMSDMSDENIEVEEGLPGDSTATTTTNNSPASRAYYMQNIPLTPDKIEASDVMITDALYSAGLIYKESLNDSLSAYITFSDLIERYPNNSYALQSCYHLYKLCDQLNKITEMNFYKSRILNEFPASNYAKIVADPQYFIRMSQQKGEAEVFYSEVYEAFKNEQHFLVIDMCEKALANFNDTILIPKFDYLKTLSEGRIGTMDDLISNLDRIITSYPQSEIMPMAQRVLLSLTGDGESSDSEAEESLNSIYEYNPDTFHNYILIVKTGSVNLDALKIRLSDFNRKYSRSKRYAISSFELNEQITLVTISRFNNAQLALRYFAAVTNDNYVLSIFENTDNYEQFVISNDNYLLFYKDKNVDNYVEFYKRYYEN